MADLLIKGVEMPSGCINPQNGNACPIILYCICGRTHPLVGERGADCPLVEVPTPHGRLIDADRALGRMWNALYALEDKREEQHGLDVMERVNIQDGFEAGQRVVADAPTVIEASEVAYES